MYIAQMSFSSWCKSKSIRVAHSDEGDTWLMMMHWGWESCALFFSEGQRAD